MRFDKLVLCTLLQLTPATFFADNRETLFDENWKFHHGSLVGAESPDYDDSGWRIVNLPHDWSIERATVQVEGITTGPFSRMSEHRYPADKQMGGGGWDVGHTIGGIGWYRKEFTIDKEDSDKLFTLYIEAASFQSEVWINGHKAYVNHYGYTPHRIDMTPYLNTGNGKNVITVKAVNEGHNSRWYAGSGLYRNVWLIKTDRTHLDKWDTFLSTKSISGKKATVNFSTVIHGKGNGLEIGLKIISPEGKEVLVRRFPAADIDSLRSAIEIARPKLWSPDSPQLYDATVSLYDSGRLIDRIDTKFGIRTIEATAEKGLKLNGKAILLKGCCIHHDNGLLGAAAVARADEHRVELLKANGFNAVRCSHNLASESFYNACDRLGMMVIHETFDQWLKPKRPEDYHLYFEKHAADDLSAGIRRDRNHPSVIMWSIGNEIPGRNTPEGMEAAMMLRRTVLALDSMRPVTAAICGWDFKGYSWEEQSAKSFAALDICGYNYLWNKYENDHLQYPQRVMYGSESYPKEAARNWNMVEKHPYLIGDFVWTAIDYVGEAGLAHTLEMGNGERDTQFMDWPWYNAWCGDIDLIGNKKPQAYFRNVLWGVSPIAMAVRKPVADGKREVVNGWGWTDERQSWTWNGLEGQTMTVNVYSRSPKVSLTLNGRLIGIKETGKDDYTATFKVPYSAGELVARNIGKDNGSFTLKTAGKADGIRLKADRTDIGKSNHDLSFVSIEIVDTDGNVLPDAAIPLEISCNGPAKVIAGNGSYNDMESFRSLTPKTFRGRALAIVQPENKAGTCTVTVKAKGLEPKSVTINMK
ncbi:glycoside hydrolase family 2 TIM barrel-domain containing protein [Xylanibacter muris]|uniref:Glycoside hydrolase family 2 protein n=1 Tax=Xylanibacter muris TaxID=2736290 RepID=A0ABX2ARE5_9BACT|nr:glycoside hydrolase family 2 TIM barrel-domain containing protein [Xylanibacter muris]NPD92789.1 glycoside hydrolase family 2 protein [Xylanibacter muris]